MATGRPTKCTPELLEKTRHYIDNYESYGDLVPSVAGLCVEIGISRETAHKWRREEEKYPEFAGMLMEMLSVQERKLLSGGLGGHMNSNITKLMLCKHGYSDKQETAITGADGGPVKMIAAEMSEEEASKIYKENLKK